jgi:hypothetical protein
VRLRAVSGAFSVALRGEVLGSISGFDPGEIVPALRDVPVVPDARARHLRLAAFYWAGWCPDTCRFGPWMGLGAASVWGWD